MQKISSIHLNNGRALCPYCEMQKMRFKLYPVLMETTRGRDIPLFCRHCKTQYIVSVNDPSVATIEQIISPIKPNSAT